MNKEELKKDAEKDVLRNLLSVIDNAYNEGYKAGYNDGASHKESLIPTIVSKGVKYVDLGLESGTKWSFCYLNDEKGDVKHFTYEKASKLNIPTKEQFEELKKHCQLKQRIYTDAKYVSCIGTNGQFIELHDACVFCGGIAEKKNGYKFWLRNEEGPIDGYAECVSQDNSDQKLFIGYELPVMLVK